MVGRVLRKNTEGGFFFIRGENETFDRFVHASECIGLDFSEVTEGMPCEFTPQEHPKGKRGSAVIFGDGTGTKSKHVLDELFPEI